jgi:hypothetical protein
MLGWLRMLEYKLVDRQIELQLVDNRLVVYIVEYILDEHMDYMYNMGAVINIKLIRTFTT